MKSKLIKSMISLALCSTIVILAGCQSKSASTTDSNTQKKVTLSFAVNFTAAEVTTANLKTIAANFEKENPGIHVDVNSLPNYGDTMSTKMAANDLPDIFTTHGWSVAKYSEYLLPLQDQPWASKINPLIKPVITNKDGKVFVLPMDVDVAGIAFNKDVLDEAGVDPNAIKTWDDFKAACEKVKAKGKTPIQLGGTKDDWTVGNFFDWVCPSFFITNESKNYRSQLKDGSFDWKNYKPVYDLFTGFNNAGYFNKDAKEGTYATCGEALAKGTAAFAFFGNYVIGEATKLKADGKYGFMPLPAATADDKPTVISGERTAIGIWKDSKNKAEALKFLEYLSKPENINLVAKGNLNPTGLVGDGYKTDAGNLNTYFDNASKYRSFGYFDRDYLPNGMWDSLCKTGDGMLFNSMNFDQVSQRLKADYDKLRKQ